MANEFTPPPFEEEIGPIVADPNSPADAPLAEKVAQALWDYYPMRAVTDGVRVVVDRGVVTLTGAVRTDGQKLVAGEIAARLSEVHEVRNELLSDDELSRAVGLALASDARTSSCHILVGSAMLGAVRLRGSQSDASVAAAAAEIARQVPGVREVVTVFDR